LGDSGAVSNSNVKNNNKNKNRKKTNMASSKRSSQAKFKINQWSTGMRMQRVPVVMLMVCLLSLCGCATTVNKSTAEKRQAVLDMKNEVLSNL
jgi:hypothetical protein